MIAQLLESIRAAADRRRHRNDQHGLIFVNLVDGPMPPRRDGAKPCGCHLTVLDGGAK